jgi:hypothetical protein
MARKTKEGVHPVRVFTAKSLTEAQLATDFLRHEGIPAQIEDEHAHDAFGGAGHVLDVKGGVGVVVPSDREPETQRLLVKFRSPARFDDDEVAAEKDEESE